MFKCTPLLWTVLHSYIGNPCVIPLSFLIFKRPADYLLGKCANQDSLFRAVEGVVGDRKAINLSRDELCF
jgi:hypothetical protein